VRGRRGTEDRMTLGDNAGKDPRLSGQLVHGVLTTCNVASCCRRANALFLWHVSLASSEALKFVTFFRLGFVLFVAGAALPYPCMHFVVTCCLVSP